MDTDNIFEQVDHLIDKWRDDPAVDLDELEEIMLAERFALELMTEYPFDEEDGFMDDDDEEILQAKRDHIKGLLYLHLEIIGRDLPESYIEDPAYIAAVNATHVEKVTSKSSRQYDISSYDNDVGVVVHMSKEKKTESDPNKHFDDTTRQLRAMDDPATLGPDYGEEMVSKLTEEFAKDYFEGKVPWHIINSNDLREKLKKLGYGNKYYKHSPLILKLLIGEGPPDIPPDMMEDARNLYKYFRSLKTEIADKKYVSDRAYRFFIFKIFEHLFIAKGEKDKAKEYKRYVFFQSDTTIKSCSLEWERFCSIADIEFLHTYN